MADPLTTHLRSWVGEWPPTQSVQVVGNPNMTQPGWDGSKPFLRGVGDGTRVVIGVPPPVVDEVRSVVGADLQDPELGLRLAAIFGLRKAMLGTGVFRWTHLPTALRPAGRMVLADDPRLPEWLRPFNGGVLAHFDHNGLYVAGVGRKIHDPCGHEIAVGTVPSARSKGLARRLVATAARRILAEGAVPTYLHARSNIASARVAAAAGFPDRGWRIYGLWGR